MSRTYSPDLPLLAHKMWSREPGGRPHTELANRGSHSSRTSRRWRGPRHTTQFLERDDHKLLVRLRTVAPLLIK